MIPELVITGMDLPPYSTRGAVQTLAPIQAKSRLARTINGNLKDLSDANFDKFASQITCTDQQVPVFATPGAQVTVECLAELSYLASSGSPQRPVVPGSERVDGDYVFYRPILVMRVVAFSLQHDEWSRQISWTLDLEEV